MTNQPNGPKISLVACPSCGGDGEHEFGPCRRCGGNGFLDPGKRRWNVNIDGTHAVLCALILGAAIIAASGHDGWGWMLLIAWIMLVG